MDEVEVTKKSSILPRLLRVLLVMDEVEVTKKSSAGGISASVRCDKTKRSCYEGLL